ncbi:MAG TPA: hypothetical protein VMU95_06375 [Trebonia sp.]|nr:hypothetical protein [Trebonia sp.]
MYQCDQGNDDSIFVAWSDGQLVTSDWPFSNRTLDSEYLGDPVLTLHDDNADSLCVGEAAGEVMLNPCSGSGILWVYSADDYLANVTFSDTGGLKMVMSALGTDNKSAVKLVEPGDETWQVWGIDGGTPR